ncbi:RICIN domain-containing protein, partial [Streptomyces sp. SM14]
GDGRPNKPILAGAALAGALLIATPLLFLALDQSDDDTETVTALAAEALLKDESDQPAEFVAEPPTVPEPEPEEEEEEEPEPDPEPAPAVVPDPEPEPEPEPEPTETEKAAEAATARTKQDTGPPLEQVLIKNDVNGTCVAHSNETTGGRNYLLRHLNCSQGTENMRWNLELRFENAGPGGSPLYTIRNDRAGYCMDLPGKGPKERGTKVHQARCFPDMEDNQLWWLDEKAPGKYFIRNFASSDFCLDSFDNNDPDKVLMIWSCDPIDKNNHAWTLVREP